MPQAMRIHTMGSSSMTSGVSRYDGAMSESPAGEPSHTPEHHEGNSYLETKTLHLLGYLIDLKAQSTGAQRKAIIQDIQTLQDHPTEGTVQRLEMKWHRH